MSRGSKASVRSRYLGADAAVTPPLWQLSKITVRWIPLSRAALKMRVISRSRTSKPPLYASEGTSVLSA